MHSTRRVVAVMAACTATAGLAGVAPAQGAVLDSGSDSFEFTEVIRNFCDVQGLRVRLDATVQVDFKIDQRGSEGLAYYSEHLDFTGVFTNVRTGAYVTSVESSMSKDLSVTDNGDGTLTIVAFGTGNAVVYDSSGQVIARNPGQTRFVFTVDNNGTPTDPFDDEFISFDGVILGSTGRTDNFCEAVVPELT